MSTLSNFVLPLISLCISLGTPGTAGHFTVPSVSAAPGTRIVLPISWTDSELTPVANIRFDLHYDASVLTVDVIRNGTIFELLIYIDAAAPPGAYLVTLCNVVISQDGSNDVWAPGSVGTVTVDAIGIVNRASLLSGPVVPGEVVRITGSSISPDCTVLFDETPAPLLDAAPNYIDLTVPSTVSGKRTTRIQVVAGNRLVGELTMPVGPAAPGIATADQNGIGPAHLLNEDLSVNSPSNPAAPGTAIAILTTGMGSGTTRIGNENSEVLSSVAAAEDVIIAKVPENASQGPSVPIAIKSEAASSQPGVTLAIGYKPPSATRISVPADNQAARGPAPHTVLLTWDASTSPDVAGYTVYRAATSGGPYMALNTDLIAGLTYQDTVQTGQTYYYVVTATDTSQNSSDYSNEAQAIIPYRQPRTPGR